MNAAVAQPSDLMLAAPEIILVVAGLVVLLAGVFPRMRAHTVSIGLTGVILALAVIPSLWGVRAALFNDALIIDPIGLVFKTIFLVGTFLTLLLGSHFLRRHPDMQGEYVSLILFATVGMMLMATGSDMMIIFLGLEILSIALYVLVAFDRTEETSLEAGLKYFLLGAFATGFLLYGMALVYGATGTTNIGEMVHSLRWEAAEGGPLLIVGLSLILVGFAFKVAIVPFHMWTPDVYEGAPTPIAAFMSTGAKAAGFAALVRLFLAVAEPVQADWLAVLWVLAALTMTVGNILALVQTNIKRMLAYSSIAHAGYLMIAVAAIAADVPTAVSAILFYLCIYTFMNLGAFGVVAWLSGGERETLAIDQYTGLGARRPLIALLMAVFMFALAGIPPTAGFFGKFYIFRASMEAGLIGLTIIGVINSALSLYYYLRVVVVMYMKPAPTQRLHIMASPQIVLALMIAALCVMYLGVQPDSLMALLRTIR